MQFSCALKQIVFCSFVVNRTTHTHIRSCQMMSSAQKGDQQQQLKNCLLVLHRSIMHAIVAKKKGTTFQHEFVLAKSTFEIALNITQNVPLLFRFSCSCLSFFPYSVCSTTSSDKTVYTKLIPNKFYLKFLELFCRLFRDLAKMY